MRFIFRFFICIIMMISCSVPGKQLAVKEAVIVKNETPKIAFINFTILKNNDAKFKIHSVNTFIADGHLKSKPIDHHSTQDISLLCLQLDDNLKPIDSIKLDNPFVRNIEYLNDSGAFERKIIEVDSTEVVLRFQLKSSAKFISIIHEKETLSNIKL